MQCVHTKQSYFSLIKLKAMYHTALCVIIKDVFKSQILNIRFGRQKSFM